MTTLFFVLGVGLWYGLIIGFNLLDQKRRLKKIKSRWGKKYTKDIDRESVQLFFTYSKDQTNINSYCIDENTWNDFDLYELFQIIDKTESVIGSQYLYSLLHHPVLDNKQLENREEIMTIVSHNPQLRLKIQLLLSSLADRDAQYIAYTLYTPLQKVNRFTCLFKIWTFIPLIAILLASVKVISFVLPIVVLCLNFYIHILYKKKIEFFLLSVKYLAYLLNAANKISALDGAELSEIKEGLKQDLKKTKVIANKLFLLQQPDPFGIIEYIKILLLYDVTIYYSVIHHIEKNICALRSIYCTIGFLDSMIAGTAFRTLYPNFCLPTFLNRNETFSIENAFNPLLENPVSNSLQFDVKNILITGSNMAGKTTFLKTIGLNVLLAQTINTCMADVYRAPLIKVVSSIGRADNLVQGKSYYLAEVESVLRILKASEDPCIIHLLILDEIFRGTNTIERLAGTIEVLNYLVNKKDYTIVSTHDLHLCEVLKNSYSNFHFKESLCETGLNFDYKLNPGITPTKNAISLLEFVGYPSKIVNQAKKRIPQVKDLNT